MPQIQEGTFEYTLNKLVDDVLDMSSFYKRFNNDKTGAPAYDPAILLKVIFLAYSRGVTSSRKIEEFCRENTVFMALSGNSKPHNTTIAKFVSTMHNEIKDLFLQVLWICDERGLIGKEMFAIDGCKMPSNASKEWSGTIAEKRKIDKSRKRFLPADFSFDPDLKFCICPAGKRMYRSGFPVRRGIKQAAFTGQKQHCRPCKLRAQCLRYPDRTEIRQVTCALGAVSKNTPATYAEKMKTKLDSVIGKAIYAKRIASAEPPFAHIRHVMGLNRFSLRGKTKVNNQWLLFCLVHNLKKVFKYGMTATI